MTKIMTIDKVLLFLVNIIYLFVLVLAKEWKCNSGNYYQFTPRGNWHLGCCNPHQMQELQDAPSLFSAHPSLALLSD